MALSVFISLSDLSSQAPNMESGKCATLFRCCISIPDGDECASASPCGFGTLFNKNVPHILENIFFRLDYKAYKACLEVNSAWRNLLMSESYQAKAKLLFCQQILEDARELVRVSGEGNVEEAREILSSGMVDVNYQDADHRHGCQMAIATFIDRNRLALQA